MDRTGGRGEIRGRGRGEEGGGGCGRMQFKIISCHCSLVLNFVFKYIFFVFLQNVGLRKPNWKLTNTFGQPFALLLHQRLELGKSNPDCYSQQVLDQFSSVLNVTFLCYRDQ